MVDNSAFFIGVMDTEPFDKLAFSLDFAGNSEIGSFASTRLTLQSQGIVYPILEPITMVLIGSGLVGFSGMRRRVKNRFSGALPLTAQNGRLIMACLFGFFPAP